MARQECDYYENEHLHELYKYPQSTINITGQSVNNLGSFNLPEGLWLLQTKWYFYGSNPVWKSGSWYRLGDVANTDGSGVYENILSYKCMDDNEKYQGIQIVESTGTTVYIDTYTPLTGTYNVADFEISGVKLR